MGLDNLGEFGGDDLSQTGSKTEMRLAGALVVSTFGGGLIVRRGDEEDDEHGDDEDG